MKYFIYTLLGLAIGLLIFNIFQIDYNDIFGQESSGALIGILSSLCIIVLMFILLLSRKIKQKSEEAKQQS